MNGFPALLAYIPVIGWLYVFLFQRGNANAMFHLRQGIGLVLFLIGVLLGWAALAWLMTWIPYLAIVAVALFTIVILAYLYGVIALLMGMSNALRHKQVTLPFFGNWANRLPIR
jgi:uncharacterized membrane protein